MTDEEDDDIDYGDEDSENSGFFKWLQTVVVVFALCGFFGLAWYAYKSGDTVDDKDVELIKVDKTPIKEAPANPGGMEIPNQDKTVYSLIDGNNKTDKPVVERIMPAPEEPVTPGNQSEAWMSSKLKNQNDAGKNSPMMNAPILKEVDKAPAKTEQFNPGKPKEVASADTTQAPVLDTAKAPAETTPAPAPAPAKAQSTAPAPAPQKKEEADEEDDDTQDTEETRTPAPAPAASTANLPKIRVQLAALTSQAEADKVWQQLVRKFPDELGSKQHYVVRVTVKGKQYYRLQAAPLASSHAAEQLCMTLISSGQACILAK